MNDLKTAEQFYQESLKNLNKANELHEKMEATERKTVALFSRFIDGTKSISGDVELAARDNLKAIKSRDVLAVINSIVAMVIDAPESLSVSFSADSVNRCFGVIVWKGREREKVLLHENIFTDYSEAIESAIALESSLAEIIIEAKDNAEVTA